MVFENLNLITIWLKSYKLCDVSDKIHIRDFIFSIKYNWFSKIDFWIFYNIFVYFSNNFQVSSFKSWSNFCFPLGKPQEKKLGNSLIASCVHKKKNFFNRPFCGNRFKAHIHRQSFESHAIEPCATYTLSYTLRSFLRST